MRIFLYVMAGMIAGWSGLIITHLLLYFINIPSSNWFNPEYILFPIVSICLASSTVLTEILLNNPTRYKNNFAVIPFLLIKVALLGLSSGIIASFLISMPTKFGWTNSFPLLTLFLKACGWITIGLAIGIADGYSWKSRTVEGSQESRFKVRLKYNILLGIISGFIAYIVSLFIKMSFSDIPLISEPIGFIVLGICTSFLFQWLATGNMRFALRAGAGFEMKRTWSDSNKALNLNYPRIVNDTLNLNCQPIKITNKNEAYFEKYEPDSGYTNMIQEGMSVILPLNGKIVIGSDQKKVDIFVGILPEKAATIIIENRGVFIESHENNCVFIGAKKLRKFVPERLIHNQVITLHKSDQSSTFVRFVFYSQFLSAE
jgi:hypothetical protein